MGDFSMMAGNRNKVFPAMSVKREPPPITDASRRRATITRKWDSLEKELKSNEHVTSRMVTKRQQSETMSTSTFDDVSTTSSSYQTTPSPMSVYHRGNRSERRNAKTKKKKQEPKKKEKEKDATTVLVDKLHSSLDNLDRFLQTNLQDEIFLARKDMMPKHFEKSEKLRSRWKKLEQDLVYEELLVTINDAKDRKKSTGSNPLTPIGEEPEEKGPKSATSDSHRLSPEGASSHDNDVEHEKSSSTKGKGSSKGKPKGRQESVHNKGQEVEKHHVKADIHNVPEQRITNLKLSRNTDVDVPLGDVPSEEEYRSQEHRSSKKISNQSDTSLKRNQTFEGSNDSFEKRVSTVSNHSYAQSRKTSVLSKQSNSNITLLSKQSTIVSTQSTTIGGELAEDEEDEELGEGDDEENIEGDEEENQDESVEEDEEEEEEEEEDDEEEEDEEEVDEDDEEEEDLQPLMESEKNIRDDSQIKSMVDADVEDDENVTEKEKLKEAEIAQEAVSERDSVSQCSPGRKDSTEEEEENENGEDNDETEIDDDEEEETGVEEDTEEEEEEEGEMEKTKRNSVIVSECRSEIDRHPVSKANDLARQENVQEDGLVLDKNTTNIVTSDDSYVEKENDLDEDDSNSDEDDNDDDNDEEEENDVEEDDEEDNECEEEVVEENEEKIENAANKKAVKMSHKMSEESENQMYENDHDTDPNSEEINTPLDIQKEHKESTYSPKKNSISKKETISDQPLFSNVRSIVDCVLSDKKKTSVVNCDYQNKITVENNQNSIEKQNQKKRSTTPETLMGDGGVYIHRPKKQRKKERPPSTPHSRHGKRKGKYEENPYIATANEIRRQIHPTRDDKNITDTKTKDHKAHSRRGKVPKMLGLVNELSSSRVHMSTSPSTRNDNHVSPRSRLGSHSDIDRRERNKRPSKSKSPASKSTSSRDRSRKRNVSETSKAPALLSVSTEMMTLNKDKMHANLKDGSPIHTHKNRKTKTNKNGKLKKNPDLSSVNHEDSFQTSEPSTRVRKQGEASLKQPTSKIDNDKSEVEIRNKELCKSDDGAISQPEGSSEAIHKQNEMGSVRTKCDDDSKKPDMTSKEKAHRKSVVCRDEKVSSFSKQSEISKQDETVANASEGQPEKKIKKSRKSKGQMVQKQKVSPTRDEGMDVMNYVRKPRIVYDSVQVKTKNSNDTVKMKTSRVRRAKKSVVGAEGVNSDAVSSVYDGKVEVRTSGVKHKKKGKDKTKKRVQKSNSYVDLESQATSEGSESSKHRLESQPGVSKPSKEMMERAREAKEVYTPPRPSLGEKRAERVKAVEEIRAEEKRQEERIRRKKKHDAEKRKSKSKKSTDVH